jgi:porphobilinogen synthase
MQFPTTRLRRLRQTKAVRNLLSETKLIPDNLIAPLFIIPGKNTSKEINSLPGQSQLSVDKARDKVLNLADAGIRSVILFGIPDYKDETGSASWQENGIIQNAIIEIKKASPQTTVMTDLCFCEYTSHGHCGVMKGDKLDNDATLELLVKQAISHVQAGADIIAPSGMIDGSVQALRKGLDQNKFTDTLIMSYSAKFASSFYGPFREAVNSSPQFGDRKTYQMNPANIKEALREVELDINEGADIVMVKPALAYLDVLKAVKDRFLMPTAAYSVSGEYAMVKLAAEKGLIDGNQMMIETLLSIKRAGADMIITYFAEEAAVLFNDGKLNDF